MLPMYLPVLVFSDNVSLSKVSKVIPRQNGRNVNPFGAMASISRRQERAMDRVDRPRTSIDERMLSGRRAVMIV